MITRMRGNLVVVGVAPSFQQRRANASEKCNRAAVYCKGAP
ncbi:hypothetical protein BVG79_02019 [Ketogulonicigenium robustum]|uniref:Uncharacterized protein n=1 Tax=Ketogulonicigenium robustum TaxID=92947 RepID=A0A1W6P1P4_9RHOB|nr:hypothetical protein BVG79_02019 [Ketogulonicigenium robustum]